mgnify:CR=1 FL=1
MSLYAYINLQKTDYKPYNFDYKILPKNTDPQPLLDIYRSYAIHKNFESAWPVYAEEFSAPHNDIIGYYDQGKIVAWSMIYKVAKRTVWSMQFAWDYKKPELKLGYKSLRHELGLESAKLILKLKKINSNYLREDFDWDLSNYLWVERFYKKIDIGKKRQLIIEKLLVNFKKKQSEYDLSLIHI